MNPDWTFQPVASQQVMEIDDRLLEASVEDRTLMKSADCWALESMEAYDVLSSY